IVQEGRFDLADLSRRERKLLHDLGVLPPLPKLPARRRRRGLRRGRRGMRRPRGGGWRLPCNERERSENEDQRQQDRLLHGSLLDHRTSFAWRARDSSPASSAAGSRAAGTSRSSERSTATRSSWSGSGAAGGRGDRRAIASARTRAATAAAAAQLERLRTRRRLPAFSMRSRTASLWRSQKLSGRSAAARAQSRNASCKSSFGSRSFVILEPAFSPR